MTRAPSTRIDETSSSSAEDRQAIEEYRRKYGMGPFLAADAVVRSSDGLVLLIRRSRAPGRGLLALPGGFVEPNETFLEAAAREVFEETGLRITGFPGRRTLAGFSPEREAIFDAPNRDPRARIVSVAYYFPMRHPARAMPAEAGDDAVAAVWMKVEEGMQADHFFADHFQILRHFGLVPESGSDSD